FGGNRCSQWKASSFFDFVGHRTNERLGRFRSLRRRWSALISNEQFLCCAYHLVRLEAELPLKFFQRRGCPKGFHSNNTVPSADVSLPPETRRLLVSQGIRSRVVSMPTWDIFQHQTQEYRDSVLPPHITARVAIDPKAANCVDR